MLGLALPLKAARDSANNLVAAVCNVTVVDDIAIAQIRVHFSWKPRVMSSNPHTLHLRPLNWPTNFARLVLSDIGLPDMTGYEVARRLRETPWGAKLTLIAA